MWNYTSGKVRQVYEKDFDVRVGNRTLRIHARILESNNPTNKGDSGGPLANDLGELVGVTQGGAADANSVSTFIDIEEVRTFLQANGVKLPETSAVAARPSPAKPVKETAKPAAPSDDRATADEKTASSKLRVAKIFLDDHDTANARKSLEEIVTKFPQTKAAIEARELLTKLPKAK